MIRRAPVDHAVGLDARVLPLLKGEGWGEVCELSEKVTHLTLSLSFQERGPAVSANRGDQTDGRPPPRSARIASARPSTWASLWAAENATRRRAVPTGTVGGRMATTR